MRLLAAIVVLQVVSVNATLGDDWPTEMHDNVRSGVTAERLAPPLQLAWTYRSPFPPAPGWSLPVNGYGARKNKPNVSHDDAPRVIAVGDTCYFCSTAENRLIAVDAASGRVRWSFCTAAAPRLAPAFWMGKLYFGADDGLFRCLDARTGRLLWQIDASPEKEWTLGYGRFQAQRPIRAGGIVEEGVAYFTAGLFPQNGIEFWAVNAEDGRVLWRRRLDRGGMGNVVPQGYILASRDSLWLTSRIAPTRWMKSGGMPVDFNTPFPQVPEAHEYRYYNGGTEAKILGGIDIVYGRACMLAYDPDVELQDKWGRTKKGRLRFAWFGARQMLFDDPLAFVATDDYLAAVQRGRLEEITENECRRYEEAYKRLRVAGYLDLLERHRRLTQDVGTDHLEVRELENGPLKWGRENWEEWNELRPRLLEDLEAKCQWMTRSIATEAMIKAADVIYAGNDDHVFAFDASTGKELWHFTTDSRVRGLAVANGRLYVSTIDGCVRCFARSPVAENLISQDHEATRPQVSLEEDADSVALQIVKTLESARGYCLILGADSAALAAEIARETELHIVLMESDEETVERLRCDLAERQLHGTRVVVHQGAFERLPYPPYLFNLVIDEGSFARGTRSTATEELLRVAKPCGGRVFLLTSALKMLPATQRKTARSEASVGRPRALAAQASIDGGEVAAIGSAQLPEWNATVRQADGFAEITRGPLPGARDWTHNYATAANTYCSEDPLVRGPFGVLWYGEPGPRERIDRHATPPVPLVVGATMFTVGNDCVMAYDIYNGICLWRRQLNGAGRRNLPINTSNLAADRDSLFVAVEGGRCLRLDAASGETVQTYTVPDQSDGQPGQWAWIARDGDLLLGSCAERDFRGRANEQTSGVIFALQVSSGREQWIYRGTEIDHDGIAVAEGKVFLVDRDLTAEERNEAGTQRVQDDSVPDRVAVDRRGDPIAPDLRKLVVLDATTGDLLWKKPWNMSDVTIDDLAVQGKSGVACMVANGVLVVHGTGSLGHPHREFLKGEFARRALYAFDASAGEYLWGGRRGYRKRPIIVGDRVYAEPFSWDLKSGDQVTVPNPLSGKSQPFDFHRGYIGCGHLLASASTLFGACDGVAFCNLDEQTGFTPFAGLALACGLGATPAGGVFVVPEGRSGCTCDTPIHTSISLYPKRGAEAWSVGFCGGCAEVLTMPVEHVSINLGAHGYRQDAEGNLWIPYPARVHSGPLGDWLPTYQHSDEMCYEIADADFAKGSPLSWVYATGYTNEKPLRFPLRREEDKPALYTIELHFAEPENAAVGERVFSVEIQGKLVLESFDPVAAAGEGRASVAITCPGILVERDLEIRLIRAADSSRPPILCGFQAYIEIEDH